MVRQVLFDLLIFGSWKDHQHIHIDIVDAVACGDADELELVLPRYLHQALV